MSSPRINSGLCFLIIKQMLYHNLSQPYFSCLSKFRNLLAYQISYQTSPKYTYLFRFLKKGKERIVIY